MKTRLLNKHVSGAAIFAALALLTAGAAVASAAPTTGAPQVSTDEATQVSLAGATLHGKVNPRGLATTYYFQYGSCSACVGPTSPYTSQTPTQSAGSGTTAVAVSAAITGPFTADAIVHYRLVAINSAGTTYGSDRSFEPHGTSASEQTDPQIRPRRGHRFTTFTLSFTPRHDLGVRGALHSDYRVLITGPEPSCDESTQINQGTRGHRIRELFGPPTSAGWCRGHYTGEIIYEQGPVCTPTAGHACPLFPSLQADAGHFRFRVVKRHHHHHHHR